MSTPSFFPPVPVNQSDFQYQMAMQAAAFQQQQQQQFYSHQAGTTSLGMPSNAPYYSPQLAQQQYSPQISPPLSVNYSTPGQPQLHQSHSQNTIPQHVRSTSALSAVDFPASQSTASTISGHQRANSSPQGPSNFEQTGYSKYLRFAF